MTNDFTNITISGDYTKVTIPQAKSKFIFGDVCIYSNKRVNFLLIWWCKLLGIEARNLNE